MLDAPPPPTAEVSPARDVIALLERASMPTIAELSQPFYRLAGVRINPRTNAPHRGQRYRNLTLKVIADGSERKVTLPPSPVITWIGFSADGKRFAFTNMRDNGVELWIGDTATGQAKAITPAQLNSVFGSPCSFIAEGASLLCAFTNANRGAAPQLPAAPTGPNIQESRGVVASVPTVQDMLGSAHDEALFEYYATSQLATVDVNTGQRSPIGRPAIYTDFSPSPDGNFVLMAAVKRPFSWVVPYQRFPTTAADRRQARSARQDARRSADGRQRAARRSGDGPAQLAMDSDHAGDDRLCRSARRRQSEDQGRFPRQGDDAGRAIHREPGRAHQDSVSFPERCLDFRRIDLADRERSRYAQGAHLGHGRSGRDASQAVRAQLGRRLQQSGHSAPLGARVRHRSRVPERRQRLHDRRRFVAEGRSALPRSVQHQDRREGTHLPDGGSNLRTGAGAAIR